MAVISHYLHESRAILFYRQLQVFCVRLAIWLDVRYAQDTTTTRTKKQEFSFGSVVEQEGVAVRLSNVGRYSEFSARFHRSLNIFVDSECFKFISIFFFQLQNFCLLNLSVAFNILSNS